jgi:hypothetical protein
MRLNNQEPSNSELPPKLSKLLIQLENAGFIDSHILSVDPIKIQLPYKYGVNSPDSRQILTTVLDQNFGDWSCSTEFNGKNYLIAEL